MESKLGNDGRKRTFGDVLTREETLTEYADSVEEGIACIKEKEYAVVFLGESACKFNPGEAVAALLKAEPETRLVYVDVPEHKGKIAEALTAGALAYLAAPPDPFEVLQTFRRVLTLTPKYKPDLSDGAVHPDAAGLGKVFSIMGVADNSGKTTVAINLAAALAGCETEKVCVVDLDFQFGDVHRYMGVKPQVTFADLAVGVAVEKKHMTRCLNGIDLLASPAKPELAEIIDPAYVQSVLQQLRRMYSYVIVDTAAGFNETNVSVIDATDTIVLVVTMDNIAAVKNIKICLDTLKKLNFPDEHIKIVLNRDGAASHLDILNVQQALGRGFDMRLPNDFPSVTAAINSHDTVIAKRRSTKLAQGIQALADSLHSHPEKPDVPSQSFVERVRHFFSKNPEHKPVNR